MVTVLRNVTVAMVKEELLKVLQLNILSTGSVILAEVLSHYIHRVLVSTSLSLENTLCCVNIVLAVYISHVSSFKFLCHNFHEVYIIGDIYFTTVHQSFCLLFHLNHYVPH